MIIAFRITRNTRYTSNTISTRNTRDSSNSISTKQSLKRIKFSLQHFAQSLNVPCMLG